MLVVRGLLDRDLPSVWMAAPSAGERARAERFTRPGAGLRFLRARALLRVTLSEVTGVAPERLLLRESERGKPVLDGGPDFSLSHSGPLVVIAIARRGRVGVDIERLVTRRDPDRLARAVLTDRERASFDILAGDERLSYLLARFTIKEAIAKASGLGLSTTALRVDPGEVPVVEDSGSTASWTAIEGGGVAHLRVGDCAVGAVAHLSDDVAHHPDLLTYRDVS